MPSGGSAFHTSRKHLAHLRLIERMLDDRLAESIAKSRSLKEVFVLLRSYPTIGDFLAFQYAIDINYSTLIDFSEMEFVMPGPGARDGIRKCFSNFGGLREAEIIRLVTERQEVEFSRLGLEFPWLGSRRLQLIDVQNLFCEVDKYARVVHPEIAGVSGRTRIKQKFHPRDAPICYFFPPKWKIDNGAFRTHPHDKQKVRRRVFPLFDK
jgi:hypothetical protein